MKNKFLTFSILAIALLVFNSCSKEKQLEKTLHKGDGTWNVELAEWEQISQSTTTGQSVVTGTSADAGNFTFDKEGDCTYNFTLGTQTYSESIAWTVNDESFSITKISQNIDFFTGDITQIVIAFSGAKIDKNTLTMTGSDTRQYTSGDILQTVMAGTFTLSKE